MNILALDPGNEFTGYALLSLPDFKLLDFNKSANVELIKCLRDISTKADAVAIEKIASYGMPVGADVFDTCIWIGRFVQELGRPVEYIFRREEKISICGSMKAKDSNIRQELINRYAKKDFKTGKGTKKDPDTFYGVSADVWQAIAVGVTCYEKISSEKEKAPSE